MSSDEITDYPGKDNPAVKEAIKSGTWKVKLDKSTGKAFFYNPSTKETTWDLVKKLGTAAASSSAARPKSPTKTPTKPTPTTADSNNSVSSSNNANANATSQPAAATTTASSSNTAGSSNSNSSSRQDYQAVQLSDPIQRLLDHNKKLVSDIATHEAQAIKEGMSSFETRLDLLVHANNVMAVQLDRRNQDALALQRALTEAHDTIHKLRNEAKAAEDQRSLSYAKTSLSGASVTNDEAKRSIAVALETVGRTVVHLQEQNRSLSATIANLTTQLVQNVQTSAASRGVESVSADAPHEWWKNAKGYSVAALTSRFLDSPGRNALCPKCTLRVSDFRDNLLREVPMSEAQQAAEKQVQGEQSHGGGGAGGAVGSMMAQVSPSPYRGSPGGHHQPPARPQPQYVAVNAFRGPTNTGGSRSSPGAVTPGGGAMMRPQGFLGGAR